MRAVTVVGASLAGLSTARALRDQGYDGRLVVIGAEPHRPYDRPPLSKEFLAGTMTEPDLALEGQEEDLGIDWRLGAVATALDPFARTVVLDSGEAVRSDGLVLACGASARRLPGTEGVAGVHVLRTLDDARALRAELVAGRRLVVIGAGFIGSEVASTARGLGLDVTVVEALATPLAGPLGPVMGAVVSGLHSDHGVRLLCGTGVRGITGPGRVEGVELLDGRVLPADLVLVGVGARPVVGWLASSGVTTTADGVVCDATGATSIPWVVAVGDCAAWYDEGLDAHHRVEHWTAARERASTAAACLLSGGTAAPPPARPAYFWSDQYGVRLQFAGHARAGDTVTVEEGSVEERSFLAVYRRDDRPVAVLALDRVRSFTRWRRQLAAVPAVKTA